MVQKRLLISALLSLAFSSFGLTKDILPVEQKKLNLLKAHQEIRPVQSKPGLQSIDPKTLSEIQKSLGESTKQLCFEILKSPDAHSPETVAECKKSEAEIRKATAGPKRADLQCEIPLPLNHPGCEGECCGIPTKPLVAKQAQNLYEKPSLRSKIIGKIEKDEVLKDFELLMITLQMGEVQVMEETYQALALGLKKGDVLKTLSYVGEGFYTVCLGNKRNSDLGLDEINPVREAKIEQWTKVIKKNGITGYTPEIAYKQLGVCG